MSPAAASRARRMATSGVITYLVMEDQFPSVAWVTRTPGPGTGMPGPLIGNAGARPPGLSLGERRVCQVPGAM